MRCLVGQGLGDAFWYLLKAKSLAEKFGDGIVDIRLGCWNVNEIESRATKFLNRFDFVNSAEMYLMPRNSHGPVLKPGPATDNKGYYRYLDDGKTTSYKDIDFIAIPNAPLEKGIDIKDWLPDVAIDYDIMQNNFAFTDTEIAFGDDFKSKFGDYVVFFMASLGSNTAEGHNRNSLFSPQDWIILGENLHNLYNVNIIVVGAKWDKDYFDKLIKPNIKGKRHWFNYIDQLPIFLTLQVIKNSRFLISYQSGLGIVGNYMESKVAMWWRPYGDSISPHIFTSFDEKMSYCWAKPGTVENKKYMSCIYGRHGVKEILNHIKENSW